MRGKFPFYFTNDFQDLIDYRNFSFMNGIRNIILKYWFSQNIDIVFENTLLEYPTFPIKLLVERKSLLLPKLILEQLWNRNVKFVINSWSTPEELSRITALFPVRSTYILHSPPSRAKHQKANTLWYDVDVVNEHYSKQYAMMITTCCLSSSPLTFNSPR